MIKARLIDTIAIWLNEIHLRHTVLCKFANDFSIRIKLMITSCVWCVRCVVIRTKKNFGKITCRCRYLLLTFSIQIFYFWPQKKENIFEAKHALLNKLASTRNENNVESTTRTTTWQPTAKRSIQRATHTYDRKHMDHETSTKNEISATSVVGDGEIAIAETVSYERAFGSNGSN